MIAPTSSCITLELAPDGASFQAYFPNAIHPDGPGHRVTISGSDADIVRTLRTILRERRRASRPSTIGTPSAPTQHQLESLAAELMRREREAALAARAHARNVASSADELVDLICDL